MFTKLLAAAGLWLGRRLSQAAGFFSGFRILWLVIPLLAAVSASSFWAGKKWADGEHAVYELAQLDGRIEQFNQAAARAYNTALQFEQARQIIDKFYNDQDQEFRAYVEANRDRLSDCDIGPDGLRLWNRWNQGPAVAEDPAKPGDGLP